MTINEYLEDGILSLTVSPVVDRFQIITRRETDTDGYLRIRAILLDKGLLEISIYGQFIVDAVHLIDYRFHWQDKDGKLKIRWDNARHHQELKTFPDHVHTGEGGYEGVKESASVNLSEVLRTLEEGIPEG
ncbi:MAG: hypothetical protein HY786_09150 [Deltaproteobacteria bacterium]|nr:hypothetical protein [Deltaproteobacteria bacterium]